MNWKYLCADGKSSFHSSCSRPGLCVLFGVWLFLFWNFFCWRRRNRQKKRMHKGLEQPEGVVSDFLYSVNFMLRCKVVTTTMHSGNFWSIVAWSSNLAYEWNQTAHLPFLCAAHIKKHTQMQGCMQGNEDILMYALVPGVKKL
ncbi:hypothetical protein F2P79_008857 [Pimephales promelas]|nr:hypothetical protein F2P79_008857 [Pimephales promelas]